MAKALDKLSRWILAKFLYLWLFLFLLITAIVGLAFYLLPLSDAIQALFLAIQSMLMFVLVLVTWSYALETRRISRASQEAAKAAAEQADSSRKVAEEATKQTLIISRPTIIQKAVHEKDIYEGSTSDYFSHFEIYNAGSGPAIELEILLLSKSRDLIEARRETFLRAAESPIKFCPLNLAGLEESTYYLVSQYKSLLSRTTEQTWLPFKLVKSSTGGKVYLAPDELEFKSEVPEKDRIEAFGRGSDPK
jgi:hypothetical protein